MVTLVIGGAGYMGKHTAHTLRRRGHEVIIYDNFSTGHRALARGFELIVGEASDSTKMVEVLRRVDAVLRVAACAYVGESVIDPRKFENNVRTALSLVDTVLNSHLRKFIFSSSCAVYGTPSSLAITERWPRAPVSPMARAIGEMHSPETHLIPCALQAIQDNRDLQIFGNDYPGEDDTCVRDYIHVSDLAVPHVRGLEYLAGPSVELNPGTGMGQSVRQILSAVEQQTGCPVPVEVSPRPAADPRVLVADPSQAQRLLTWKAQRSLEQIVAIAWQWAPGSHHHAPHTSGANQLVTA